MDATAGRVWMLQEVKYGCYRRPSMDAPGGQVWMLPHAEYRCCRRLSMDVAGVGHGLLLPNLVLGGC